jgi:zinc protease
MRIKKQLWSLLLLAFLSAGLSAQELTQDNSYRIGKLKNGLTYYIRHNDKDKGLADFYIAQRVGSILEEPRQRGLAHFLEHMAFNGTKNFPGNGKKLGIVPWCETIGVKFGANLNAYTSIDETVYNIASVPVKREPIIDSTLLILHDWSHYLLLTDKEIDKERGVIHEEWRTRRAGMATQRMMERVLPTVYKGTKYEDCLPIGSMDIVDHFPYQDLRDYYKKWYRPDLQAIIVVGDIDVDQVEKKIQNLFGKITGPKNPAERVYYPVNDNEQTIVAVDKDSEQPIILANLYMKQDATPDQEKNTIQYKKDDYTNMLIRYMLNGRLQELQHKENSPCLSLSVRTGGFLISRTKDAFSLAFGCRQENIKGSFDAAIAETERARRYGFTLGELNRAKALYLSSAERQFAERNDRHNSYFVNKALEHFTEWEPIITSDLNLELTKKFNADITLADVNAFTGNLITDKNQVLVVYAPDKPGVKIPSNQELQQYVTEAQSKVYEPYREKELAKDIITKAPQAGKIVKETAGDKFGFKTLTLSNGVKVYVKPTDFAKDQVSMRFFGEGGTSLYPDADVPNFSFIGTAITKAGAGDFDEITLNKMLAGKIIKISPAVGNESQAINGSSSAKDLKTLLELTYLYFTSPRKDSVTFNAEIDRLRSFYTNREANPQVTYNDTTLAILYGNSPRVQPVKKSTLDHVDYNRILEIYKERFSDASNFKLVLVGNVNIDSLRPLLCQYIASLPATGKKETFVDNYPNVVAENATHKFTKKMNTPSALVNIYYTFEQPFNLKTDMTMDVLTRVLQIAYTDSVREEKGGTYGVGVDYSIDNNSKPDVLTKINFRTDPAKYEELIPIVYKQIQNIADKGPLVSSMDKVKKYLQKTYDQNIIYNQYWDYVEYEYLQHGIDYHTGFLQTLKDLTPQDVQQAAKDMLKSNRRIEITMISE